MLHSCRCQLKYRILVQRSRYALGENLSGVMSDFNRLSYLFLSVNLSRIIGGAGVSRSKVLYSHPVLGPITVSHRPERSQQSRGFSQPDCQTASKTNQNLHTAVFLHVGFHDDDDVAKVIFSFFENNSSAPALRDLRFSWASVLH